MLRVRFVMCSFIMSQVLPVMIVVVMVVVSAGQQPSRGVSERVLGFWRGVRDARSEWADERG